MGYSARGTSMLARHRPSRFHSGVFKPISVLRCLRLSLSIPTGSTLGTRRRAVCGTRSPGRYWPPTPSSVVMVRSDGSELFLYGELMTPQNGTHGGTKRISDGGDYDLIVVGAGPSGSSFVGNLGSSAKRLRILWIEAKEFPRAKPCGDGWGPRAIQEIRRLGAMEAFLDGETRRVQNVELQLDERRFRIRNPLPFYVIPRRKGDLVLRDHVLASSAARYLDGVRVAQPLVVGDRVIGVRTQTGNKGDFTDYRARLIVDASGVNSQVSKVLNLEKNDPVRTLQAARTYYRGIPGLNATAEVYYAKGVPGYFWIFPLSGEEDVANVGVGGYRKFLREQEVSIRGLWDLFLGAFPDLKSRLELAESDGRPNPWLLGLYDDVVGLQRPGVLFLGEATNLVEYSTGGGLYFALRSGRAAAEVTSEYFATGGADDEILKRYYDLCEKAFLPHLRFHPDRYQMAEKFSGSRRVRGGLAAASALSRAFYPLGRVVSKARFGV